MLLAVASYYIPRFSTDIVAVLILATAQGEDLFASELRVRTRQYMEELSGAGFLTTDNVRARFSFLMYCTIANVIFILGDHQGLCH